ncbi:motility protein A [Thiohalorhabdus methylotrophus]|uniref:Motility protein A n=1 Tax=Thiohalorhabdus methylotrophus TaxID=3242694 RepID=A0ABV4TVZ0_9GAMM
MDIATLIGLVAAFGLVLLGILLGGTLGSFLNAPGALIVIGGTLGATLVSYPLQQVLNAGRVVKKTFFHQSENPKDVIAELLEYAQTVRKEGVLALEDRVESLENPFMQKGLQMAIDGQEPEVVEAILQNEVDKMEDRHETGAAIMDTMGSLSPAFGMIGTLIGLVQMLQSMEDPSTIGPAMAVALLTTFYGALMANAIFIPMAGKLRARSEEETLNYQIIITGVRNIVAGENPRILEQKLLAFLAPKEREPQFD